jgi:hypothetical protein
MEILKPDISDLVDGAEYVLSPSHGHWEVRVWENVVFVRVSGIWPQENWVEYFECFWNMFCERKKYWDKVYFIYETTNLPIQSVEFRNYLKENWLHLLDREDYCLSIVEPNSLKRTIWKSIYRLLNVQNKVHLFKDHPSASQWTLKDRSKSDEKVRSLKDKSSLPEELNFKWVKKHAHIRLSGKDRLWTINAYRNIIVLEIQNHWSPEDIKEHLLSITGLPSLLLEKWNKVFLVFVVSFMDFAIRDAPRFLKSDWLSFLDRDDMTTCIVQKSKFNQILWRKLLRRIGKLNRVRLFSECDHALAWIRNEIVKEAGDSNPARVQRTNVPDRMREGQKDDVRRR